MRSGRLTLIAGSILAVALSVLLPGRAPVTQTQAGERVLITVLAPEQAAASSTPKVAREVAREHPVAWAAAPESSKPEAREPEARKTEPVEVVTVDRGIRVEDRDVFDGGGPPPEGGPSGPCAKASTCPSYVLRNARWKTDENGAAAISWKFNDEGRRNLRAPKGLLESAVASSMREWSRWNSNIVFQNAGTTTAPYGGIGKDGSCDDGTNVITWGRFDPQVIAQAGVCMDKTGRIVRDADLALNVTYHWEDIGSEPESRHSFDIRSIVTHELGHWLGLLDVYSEQDVHQTMSGFAEYGETSKRTPALGDALGVQKLFPCGDGDSCPRKGIADD